MVCDDSNFIGTPNNSFLKSPAENDDDIEFYISDLDNDGAVEDSLYFITDEDEIEEILDDNSYIDDTYDEVDYYFSDDDDDDDDDEDYDEDVYLSDVDNSDTDDTIDTPAVVVRIFSDGDTSNSNAQTDKTGHSATTTPMITEVDELTTNSNPQTDKTGDSASSPMLTETSAIIITATSSNPQTDKTEHSATTPMITETSTAITEIITASTIAQEDPDDGTK